VEHERNMWQGVVVDKDAEIANQKAENKHLRAQLRVFSTIKNWPFKFSTRLASLKHGRQLQIRFRYKQLGGFQVASCLCLFTSNHCLVRPVNGVVLHVTYLIDGPTPSSGSAKKYVAAFGERLFGNGTSRTASATSGSEKVLVTPTKRGRKIGDRHRCVALVILGPP